MRRVDWTKFLGRGFSLFLVLIIPWIGFRPAVAYLNALGNPSSADPAARVGMRDRKPKPTRQQGRETVALVDTTRIAWTPNGKPTPPVALPNPCLPEPSAVTRADVESATPVYLRLYDGSVPHHPHSPPA